MRGKREIFAEAIDTQELCKYVSLSLVRAKMIEVFAYFLDRDFDAGEAVSKVVLGLPEWVID